MTVDRIAEEIASHRWYQSIDLGNGVVTPGETGDATRSKLEMMELPADLTGLSVLDVGCNEGFFSFEAERRGASRVLAVDVGSAPAAKFELVRRIVGSSVEFRRVDVSQVDPQRDGTFDLVFFLAVFHHLKRPFAVMEHLAALTGGTAIIEVVEAVPRGTETPSALVRRLSKKGKRHLLPTRPFLLEMLKASGFAEVELMGTHRFHRIKEYRDMPGFDEQRVIVKAHRRSGDDNHQEGKV